jgi:hypothetical protein
MRVTDQYHLVFRLFTTKLPMMREMGASKSIASLASDAQAMPRRCGGCFPGWLRLAASTGRAPERESLLRHESIIAQVR